MPGIGKRGAERLVLELKDKIGAVPSAGGVAVVDHAVRGPVVEALVGLGFAVKQAEDATDKVLADDAGATTASALMIGLALIAGLSVLGESVKASVREGVADELTSDFVLATGTTAPVPAPVATAVRSLPAVASVAQVSTIGSPGLIEVGANSKRMMRGVIDAKLRSFSGKPSTSSSFAQDAGITGCARIATCRTTSAVV